MAKKPFVPRERIEFLSFTKDLTRKVLKVQYFCTRGTDILHGDVNFMILGGSGDIEGPENIDAQGYVEHGFTKFPGQDKVVVRAQLAGKGLYQNSPQIDISDLKETSKHAGAGKEPTFLHVRRIPLDSNKWLLEGELRSRDTPVADFLIRILQADTPHQERTAPSGSFSKELTISQRIVVPVIATSRLAVHVPLLGPDIEKPTVSPPPATGWRKHNNRVFLWATVLFFWILGRTLWDIGESVISPAPYTFTFEGQTATREEEEWEKEARRIREQYSGGSSQPSTPSSPKQPTKELTKKRPQPPGLFKKFVDMLVPFVSYTSWHDPHSWFRIWFTIVYFLVLIVILAPLCFYDEVWALLKGTTQKVRREATGFGQKRVAQEYTAEIKEQEGRVTTVFYVDGKEVESTAPKPQEGTKLDLTGPALFKRMLKAEILGELIVKIFGQALKRFLPF